MKVRTQLPVVQVNGRFSFLLSVQYRNAALASLNPTTPRPRAWLLGAPTRSAARHSLLAAATHAAPNSLAPPTHPRPV